MRRSRSSGCSRHRGAGARSRTRHANPPRPPRLRCAIAEADLDPTKTRALALREAMLALIDGDGFNDDAAKPCISYAHPLFWAPYRIIGDGG